MLPKTPLRGCPWLPAPPWLPVGHEVHLPPRKTHTPKAKDDTGPVAHLQFDTRLFLEELDAVKSKQQHSQSQASQEVCCDQQGPRHHDLHWAGKGKKKPERGLRNGEMNWSPRSRLLPVSLLESSSSPMGMSIGDVYVGSHQPLACHVL